MIRPDWSRLRSRLTPRGILSALVVGGAALFVFWQLHPELLFADTTPAGGDMGAHVWGPAYLRDHLLPNFRLTGWTPDWYAGFPAFHFYMVVPMLAIVALDVIAPYGVAFKLVSVSGVVAMPVAAWAFGRLAGLRYPGPPMLALAALVFVFDRSFTIYGGNIPSTLAGEFAFSISLALSLLFLGVLARALDTGRHRALAAVLLALTALCHLIPALFAAMGAIVLLAMRPGLARLRLVASVAVVGGALGAWWALPFVWRRPYLNDMGWEKLTDYGNQLMPDDFRWVLALAAAGALASMLLRLRFGIFLTGLAVVLAVAFVLTPQGRLWNARLLPFWYLVLYMLAAVALAEVARALGGAFARHEDRPLRWTAPAGLAVVAALTFVLVGRPLEAVPSFLPVPETDDRSFVDSWARWNYSGYERKDAYPEYHGIVTTMARVGEERGCGRAMWEYERELDRFGTPMALMLLPHWTDGCIGSMEGLYFEASATTPYHFLIQSELSAAPSRPQRDLPYRTLLQPGADPDGEGPEPAAAGTIDRATFDAGVEHMRLLGVRYYLAFTPEILDAAHTHPDLQPVGRSGEWEVFELRDASVIAPLEHEPVVVTGVATGGREWQDLAVERFQLDDPLEVPVAAGGPDGWRRVPAGQLDDAEPRRLPGVAVRNVELGDDSIEFDVDRVGVPVLIKASYFPNWQSSGARGPYRVAPNLMVVVPTDTHVALTYGYTPVDGLAWLITLLGVAGAVWLWRSGPVVLPEPRRRRLVLTWIDEEEEIDGDGSDGHGVHGDGLGGEGHDAGPPDRGDAPQPAVTNGDGDERPGEPLPDEGDAPQPTTPPMPHT